MMLKLKLHFLLNKDKELTWMLTAYKNVYAYKKCIFNVKRLKNYTKQSIYVILKLIDFR